VSSVKRNGTIACQQSGEILVAGPDHHEVVRQRVRQASDEIDIDPLVNQPEEADARARDGAQVIRQRAVLKGLREVGVIHAVRNVVHVGRMPPTALGQIFSGRKDDVSRAP
jgi:hypothetical protein